MSADIPEKVWVIISEDVDGMAWSCYGALEEVLRLYRSAGRSTGRIIAIVSY